MNLKSTNRKSVITIQIRFDSARLRKNVSCVFYLIFELLSRWDTSQRWRCPRSRSRRGQTACRQPWRSWCNPWTCRSPVARGACPTAVASPGRAGGWSGSWWLGCCRWPSWTCHRSSALKAPLFSSLEKNEGIKRSGHEMEQH